MGTDVRAHSVRVASLREGRVWLYGGEAHHLARVLRSRPGDAVRAFDGDGFEAEGHVAAVAGDRVELCLGTPAEAEREAPLSLTLVVGLLKGDKLTQVVRQSTELGVDVVVPVVSRRADVPRLSPGKADRLARVAEQAAKQSGRARVPRIGPPRPLDEVAWEGPAWVADPRGGTPIREHGRRLAEAGASHLTAFTGPEGGFTPEEVEGLRARGATPVALGPRVLRAETAPVALAAAVLTWLAP